MPCQAAHGKVYSTVDLIEKFGWERYCPIRYTVPTLNQAYALFLHLKRNIAEEKFESDEEFKNNINEVYN